MNTLNVDTETPVVPPLKSVQQSVSEWWMTNCRIRHGHPPKAEDLKVEPEATPVSKSSTFIAVEPPPPTPPPVSAVEPASAVVADTVKDTAVGAVKDTLFDTLAPLAISSLLGLGLGLGGGVLAYYMWPSSGDSTTAVSQEKPERDGSIYQYLEDHDWHVQ